MPFEKIWTNEEELFLISNTGDMTDQELSEHLGKSVMAVRMKRYHMTHHGNSVDEPLFQPYMTKAEKIYRLECLSKELRVKLKK